MGTNKSFEGCKEFHEAFGHPVGEKPTPIQTDVAVKRAIWTAEELVEFLHATVGGNEEEFDFVMTKLQEGIKDAYRKQIKEGEYEDKSDFEIVTRQMDALTDISYFNYGSFVIAGVNPQPLFDIVHSANMAKLGPDGKPIIRESDGKIMKPEGWAENYAPEPRLRAELKKQIEDSNK
ncbi:HAD family hydrolase [Bacillus stercoris]|nr:HAD family hydrolase [Bacillus stercoris]